MAVFFESLVRVIRGARSHLSTNQVGSAEFWCRRLDEYERTLGLLLARVEGSRPDQETFLTTRSSLTDPAAIICRRVETASNLSRSMTVGGKSCRSCRSWEVES